MLSCWSERQYPGMVFQDSCFLTVILPFSLMMEVYKLLGVKKINTTVYHLHCNGLVKQFNRSLINMLSKTAQTHGQDWDEKLPFALFVLTVFLYNSPL